MNTLKLLFTGIILSTVLSCSSDDDSGPKLVSVESKTVTNLYAPQNGGQGNPEVSGDFVKFSFSKGEVTTSETDWDIAFRATTILVNGGEKFGLTDEPSRTGDAAAYIVSGTLASVTEVNSSLLTQDSSDALAIQTGSGNGWYTYTGPPSHLIKPTPGKILVFKTHDGKFAKVEITSYYLDDDTSGSSQYYSFNYVYQPNEGVTNF